MAKNLAIKLATLVFVWGILAFGSHSAFANQTPTPTPCGGFLDISAYLCGNGTGGNLSAQVDIVKHTNGALSPNTLNLTGIDSLTGNSVQCQLVATKLNVYTGLPAGSAYANVSSVGSCEVTSAKTGAKENLSVVAAFGVEKIKNNSTGKFQEYILTNVQSAVSGTPELQAGGWVTPPPGSFYAGDPQQVIP